MAMLYITADEAMAPMWVEEDMEEEKDGDRLADVIQPRSTSWGEFVASQQFYWRSSGEENIFLWSLLFQF